MPLIQQEYELPVAENSEGVFIVPQQPDSSRTPGNYIVLEHVHLHIINYIQALSSFTVC